jgi:hypothetical protein
MSETDHPTIRLSAEVVQSSFSIPPPVYEYPLDSKQPYNPYIYPPPVLCRMQTSHFRGPDRDTKKWGLILFFASLTVGVFTYSAGGFVFLLCFHGHYAKSGIYIGSATSCVFFAVLILINAFQPNIILEFLYVPFAFASYCAGYYSYNEAIRLDNILTINDNQ